ncbi:MAG TPA: winged helix-turn-helix domain-containing protein [Verrucomicrobiae bacterium]|nr:winged helix-turn-helix domain-containing protein [Verrucomicrobiae bacterium]
MSSSLPPPELDVVFAALAHTKRRDILQTLTLHPATVGQLAELHSLSLPAIHKHIRALESAGLLQRKKIGRTNFVALNRLGLRLAQQWLGKFQAFWGSDSETLENYLSHLS